MRATGIALALLTGVTLPFQARQAIAHSRHLERRAGYFAAVQAQLEREKVAGAGRIAAAVSKRNRKAAKRQRDAGQEVSNG